MNSLPKGSLLSAEIQKTLLQLEQLTAPDPWLDEHHALPQPSSNTPKFDSAHDYYEQFWKTYLTNEMVIKKISELSETNKVLVELTQKLEGLYAEKEDQFNRLKKKRRTSKEIDKRFRCPYEGCSKGYGCDVAMNLHIKLKHQGGNKTEREELARAICEAELYGKPLPDIHLKFPPSYVDSFKEAHFSRKAY